MALIFLLLLIIATSSVSCYNLSVDNPTVLYPNTIQDDFPDKFIPGLGWFATGPPWYHPLYRPISVVPSDNITFTYLLYTQDNPKHGYEFHPTEENICQSHYRIGKPVTVLVHGYDNNYTLLQPIKDELLKYEDRNVFVIDWSAVATFPYYQAVADARVVGAKIANALKFLMACCELTENKIHLVGKSLGGQLVSYIGERIKNLARITALDPALPYFHNAHKKVRLDMGDAVFVDTIHTNIGTNIYNGEGYPYIIGHADFYPNGGNHQPECDYTHFLNLTKTRNEKEVANDCSHDASQRFFASSVRKCHYKARACSSYDAYKDGICNKQVTNRMGLFATKPKTYPLQYFLDTKKSAPYCEVTK